MQNAGKVIVVPGYGMAVAQAQHALREMADLLKKEGVEVRYAIHPVAGRMPGHMNVLLQKRMFPMTRCLNEKILIPNSDRLMSLLLSAPMTSLIQQQKRIRALQFMACPSWMLRKPRQYYFKRGMGSGYAGVENELFFRPNTMLFGDAKRTG